MNASKRWTIRSSFWRATSDPARTGGFTLLEALIAFAIAGPALALLYRQGVTSLGITRAALAYQEAISRARSHLDALTDTALIPGERSGEEGAGYRWRTRIAPIAALPARLAAGPAVRSPYAAGTALYDVTVTIFWPEGPGLRSLALDTRRLGPAARDTP